MRQMGRAMVRLELPPMGRAIVLFVLCAWLRRSGASAGPGQGSAAA
jgi:hypothetical protein